MATNGTSVPLPREDPRIEQIASDPAAYYASARRRALTEARKDVARKLAPQRPARRWLR